MVLKNYYLVCKISFALKFIQNGDFKVFYLTYNVLFKVQKDLYEQNIYIDCSNGKNCLSRNAFLGLLNKVDVLARAFNISL